MCELLHGIRGCRCARTAREQDDKYNNFLEVWSLEKYKNIDRFTVVEEPQAAPTLFEEQLERLKSYPPIRFMGSKQRLIPWIDQVLKEFEYDTALDAFSGSGVVSYYFKCLGKRVITNDFLNFSYLISKATIENSDIALEPSDIDKLLSDNQEKDDFIERTFTDIFFTGSDLQFLDLVHSNLNKLDNEYQKSLALSALTRSCIKRQPRGVFTIRGANGMYNDGRRDLKLSLEEHFLEQVRVYNDTVFDNGLENTSYCGDIFDLDVGITENVDLVYMDPPYVPNSDDNDYIKRYHFVEGLSQYWRDLEIMETSKVKKIKKKFTPFSYRRTAMKAFDALFKKFESSILVLSYSSNAYPDLETLVLLMKKYKREVHVYKKAHRYHFGNHSNVKRAVVEEYLIIGF